jgi:hypothetical protein
MHSAIPILCGAGTKRPRSAYASQGRFPGLEMTPDELVKCYRLYAAECMEIAGTLEPGNKLALLNIAQAWLNLAEQIAKNSETVLVYETPPRVEEPPRAPKIDS